MGERPPASMEQDEDVQDLAPPDEDALPEENDPEEEEEQLEGGAEDEENNDTEEPKEAKNAKAKKAKKEKGAASFAVRAEEESTPWWQWPGMPGAVLIAQPEGTYDNEGEASFQREVGGGEAK